ncbi:hypothetical protein ZIOFF_075717 [Zingiber officinale]|uniref:beta-galactosidase n=1 Tax=Zingiber officinale TaxID=94328 RepID=A0A8J5BWS6_ZINOF|nr:hypothetical protein ZIOFF_075717 [Zingiber officinale]
MVVWSSLDFLSPLRFFLLLLFLLLAAQYGMTYDKKAIVINCQRKILISGSIHYPRSTLEMWEGLSKKLRMEAWMLYRPTSSGMAINLHLAIGFPVWLKYVPRISFRTDNEPFKMAMQGFTKKIVDMMKTESLFASQGGPIILSEIENEYGPESKAFGAAGHAYLNWAAQMVVGLGTGVPWVMCKENDAPDPVINTCNGFYCHSFTPNKPDKPTMWTEAWSGW